MPLHTRITEDQSKYYMRTPQEMSRHEIAELEMMLKTADDPEEIIPDEEAEATQEWKDFREEMK